VFTGDDIQRKKPDPQIFQVAAARLGVQPAACLVAEDAITGVQAAKAAGARCLGLTTIFDSARLRQAGADLTARDFTDAGLNDFLGRGLRQTHRREMTRA
jgi:beta-phosphoglucomutase-like phosphatase (HAD superfamily)